MGISINLVLASSLSLLVIPVFAQNNTFDDQFVSSTEYTKLMDRLYALENQPEPKPDLLNWQTMLIELGIGIPLALIVYRIQQRQVNILKRREKERTEYLEEQIVNALAHIKYESKKTYEELDRISKNPPLRFQTADNIWNPLGISAVERLDFLNNVSSDLIKPETLDDIQRIRAELKIELNRNIAMAMVQTSMIQSYINKLFNGALKKSRLKIIKKMKEIFEDNKRKWEEKQVSDDIIKSHKMFLETELKKYKMTEDPVDE